MGRSAQSRGPGRVWPVLSLPASVSRSVARPWPAFPERGEEVVLIGATSVRFRDGSPAGAAALSGGRKANGDRPSGTGTHSAAGGSRRGFARVHLLVLELCRAV